MLQSLQKLRNLYKLFLEYFDLKVEMILFFHSELFVKDGTVANILAKEIEDLKQYIKTCAYNAKLAIFLAHLFISRSQAKSINSLLRYFWLQLSSYLYTKPDLQNHFNESISFSNFK